MENFFNVVFGEMIVTPDEMIVIMLDLVMRPYGDQL